MMTTRTSTTIKTVNKGMFTFTLEKSVSSTMSDDVYYLVKAYEDGSNFPSYMRSYKTMAAATRAFNAEVR